MTGKRPPWQSLFDRIRVSRGGAYIPAAPASDAELDVLEAEIGSRLPTSYRAFMKRFGAGELNGWVRLERIVPKSGRPHDTVTARTARLREVIGGPTRAWLSTLVFFGSSGGGDLFVWDPASARRKEPHECRFYQLPHGYEDQPDEAGDSFWQFLEWVEADMATWPRDEGGERETGLTFHPYSLRAKKKPLKREVRAWLKWGGGTIRRLATALRAEPRADEFAVLADALQEAGCGNTDLLASCRRDAQDGDRAWVLHLLLG